VYAAVFNSGNASTILGGSSMMSVPGLSFPPNVTSYPDGPYGGQNPPPNSGGVFSPAQTGGNPAPPPVGQIVKKNALGQWADDNNHDWTAKVSGAQAADSGRVVGGICRIATWRPSGASSLSVTYATGLMNICAAVGVNPASGKVVVVGTDATNEVRFEPNVKGRFVHVMVGLVDAVGPGKSVRT
jgi:hypothetical protein